MLVVPPSTLQLPPGASVFKLYLGHILGLCDKVAVLSNPLQLYDHKRRSQVGSVLMATPNLGSPVAYVPTFYQDYLSINHRTNHEVSM